MILKSSSSKELNSEYVPIVIKKKSDGHICLYIHRKFLGGYANNCL